MASRFDDRSYPHQGHSRAYSKQPYTSHNAHHRSQSEHPPRPSASRAPSAKDDGRRSGPRRAYVEDFAESLSHEYQPNAEDTVRAAYEDPAGRRPSDTDGDPTSAGGARDDNPERRFVLIPKADATTNTTETTDQDSAANKTHHATTASASAPPSTVTPTASTFTSAGSTSTPNSTYSTPVRPSGGSSGASASLPGNDRPGDNSSEYEANTCRKFTVPRLDGDATSSHSEPSTIGSLLDETDSATGSRRHRARRHSTSKSSSLGAAAAAAAATAALAAASAGAPPKTQAPIQRRKSRADLPRIETDGYENERHPASSTASARTRSRSRVGPKSTDRHHTDRDSRGRLGDKFSHRDNDFLSPTLIKHATYGRDRPYFEYGSGSSSAHPDRQNNRARSGDPRPPLDSRRTHDRMDRPSVSADPSFKRRSSSFSESDKPSRMPSYKRPSRDETAGSRVGRNSTTYLPKDRQSSPPPGRDWDRERERERERDAGRDRRGYDQNRDRQKLSRRDSVQNKHRDSIVRPSDGYSSDERSKRSSVSAPIRRQPSERRRPLPKDEDITGRRGNSNLDAPRSLASGSGGGSSSGRHRSGGTTPLATPRQSDSQFPFLAGSLPTELFEPGGASPPKFYRDGKRRLDVRRRDSSSSPPSSPDGHARALEGDRPRGPRPRSQAPNVIHNPAGGVNSQLPPLPPQQAAAPTPPQLIPQPRSTPLPTPIPVPIPTRGVGSVRERDEYRRERRSSPVDITRGHPSLPPNPARTSGVFGHSPNTSQPYRQPAFYINLPGVPADEERLGRSPNEIAERQQDRLVNIGTPSDKVEASLVSVSRRYAEDVFFGRIKGLPECPRTEHSTQYRDWRMLTPFNDFLICPTCYDAAFARTPYRNEIVPARAIDPREKTRCTFGSLNWYRVALLFVKESQMPTLGLLRSMFRKDEELRLPCYGPGRVSGRWFTIRDPVTTNPVPKFATCEQCATAIEVLFPRLKGILQDNDPSRYDTTNICSLYYEPDRRRLWRYIDVFESINNMAVATNSPVDVNALINRLLDINRFDECKKDVPVSGRKWYSMRSLPEFTVCQECFQEAVFPKVSSYRNVAGDFYKEPKELPMASCHLYSPRMRDIFLRACQNSDKVYLEQKLQEREDIAVDISSQIRHLSKGTVDDSLETEKLLAKWKKWE